MTAEEKSKLEAAGWIVVETGFWRSPLTGHNFPERAALAIVNIKPRTGTQLYRPRYQRTAR